MKLTVPSSSVAPQRPQLRYFRARVRTVSMFIVSGTVRPPVSGVVPVRAPLAEWRAMWKRPAVRRLVWAGMAIVGLIVMAIAVGPAFFSPTGHRLAIAELPRAYGLEAIDVTFAPPDRRIALRGWW